MKSHSASLAWLQGQKKIKFIAGNKFSKPRQRGSLLIPVIVLIVVVSVLAATISMLYGVSMKSSVDNNLSLQAFYIAEAGLEKATREWSVDNLYAGEGAVPFGAGAFTLSVADTDYTGAALPSNQKRLISRGTITGSPNVSRTVERIVGSGGDLLNETFPNLNNWLTEGPMLNTCINNDTSGLQTGGQVTISAGAFMAEVTRVNERRKGYRQHTLPSPASSGSSLTISFLYSKEKGSKPPRELTMAFDLVWSDDTTTRIWNHCGTANVNGNTFTTTTTVPAGKSLTAVRLAYDVYNTNKNSISRIYFDDITITGATFGIMSWREAFP